MVNSPFAKLSPEIRCMIYKQAMALDKKYSFHETPPLLQVCSVIRQESRETFLDRVNSVRVPVSIPTNSEDNFHFTEHEKKRLSEIPGKVISKLERIDLIVQYDTSGPPLDISVDNYLSRLGLANMKEQRIKLREIELKRIELSVHSDQRCQYTVSSSKTPSRYFSSVTSDYDRCYGCFLRMIPEAAFSHYDWAASDTSKLIEAVRLTANLFQWNGGNVVGQVSENIESVIKGSPPDRETIHGSVQTMSRKANELQRAIPGSVEEEEIMIEVHELISAFENSRTSNQRESLKQLSHKREWRNR